MEPPFEADYVTDNDDGTHTAWYSVPEVYEEQKVGETVRKLRLPNPFVAKGLPSPRGMKFSIKPFVPCYENKTRSQELNLDNKCFQQL